MKNTPQQFIQRIVAQEEVWALQAKWGFASSIVQQFEDQAEDPIGIICFWSDKKLASTCAKKYWKEYVPISITLSDFLEKWCIQLYQDKLLIGTNFNWNLYGQENDPLELLLEVIRAVKVAKMELFFHQYAGVEDLNKQAKDLLIRKLILNEESVFH